jgi:hypothetical protein
VALSCGLKTQALGDGREHYDDWGYYETPYEATINTLYATPFMYYTLLEYVIFIAKLPLGC